MRSDITLPANWSSLFEWYHWQLRLVVRNGHPKDMYYNENGLFAQESKCINHS